jgi:hypothetical protein
VTGYPYITKVLEKVFRTTLRIALCLGVLPGSAQSESANPSQPQPGPAEALYLQLSDTGLDPDRVFGVRGASVDRPSLHIMLEDGTLAFTKDVLGKITGAFFEGEGEVLLIPPNEVERKSMSLFTGTAILEERFSTAYFRFNDQTAAELQPGLRAPQDAQNFVARWDETARNLAHGDAMRLLATFSEMLPVTGANAPVAARADNREDRMLHARLNGDRLGVFDIAFDSTAGEQVEAGQSKRAENGNMYYDVWTSFSIAHAARKGAEDEIPQTLPAETDSREDPIAVRRYVIDAHVKPPKELEADVSLELEVKRGGSRFVPFELSRYLKVKSVTADGTAVEFIHNPAVEGTRLARSGNDVLAVILPAPATEKQKITLHFIYGGEVIAEAGKGLLYVGERGTWYPNRGMSMAEFDLTFHYPPEWTLLATGRPVALAPTMTSQNFGPSSTGEQAAHWVSERPIPVAGFNLGKYIRGAAHADAVTVEAFATAGVERTFPQTPSPGIQLDPPQHRGPIPQIPNISIPPSPPSPARNATAVAEAAARAIHSYAERFGPFPYTQLALTQLPGQESQGWPGLVFLSSYAFLTRQQEIDLRMTPVQTLLGELVPAHEAAHQWWGDLVTWSTYRDQWFSEGLANYCSLMLLQENNPAGFRLVMEKYRNDLSNENKEGTVTKDAGPVTLGSRLLSSHFPQGYEAISYGRATWLFHMLRSMLQDTAVHNGVKNPHDTATVEEPFVHALRRVRERYEGKAISTRELLEVFAEDLPPTLRYEGKSSLDWFLDGWINGTSLPRLELQSVKFTPKGQTLIGSGVIRQKDAAKDLVTSVPVYAVVAGRAPVLAGRVFADGAESSFRLAVPAGTHKLVLDPNETILTAPK